MKEEITKLRDFPAVEELLQDKTLAGFIALVPRPIAADIVKDIVAAAKKKLQKSGATLKSDVLRDEIRNSLLETKRKEITRVINGTGILVHTNLGRAPLSESIFEAVKKTVVGYGNIEFNLEQGMRGKRGEACEKYLARLAGAESATVVNNCAAALFLILNTLANRRKVVISRGELVQIGGGFRIPDILKRSGARLCEVGTTNITTPADYENDLDDKTALILKVHKSNFTQAGFSEDVPLKELVVLGKKHGLPVVNDLGSGVFIPTKDILGYEEPTVQQSVRAGAAITCFSGDKMLGGVQAGLIVGREELIGKIKKNPIFRTVRVDKIVFSIIEKMLTVYLNAEHLTDIKLWSLLTVPEAELYKRGKNILMHLGQPEGISIEATRAFVGGGALPESAIPSVGLVFAKKFNAERLMKNLRDHQPPVVGRIENDRFIVDLKAIDTDDIEILIKAVKKNIK
ncbi:MAG: L-seryl-tRNA(Sec) selenium transferase [candidate division Zixibacteria bacterium]|nr:L-seryl-tRNA(Sec) selenium transferase [candidate division Zixibacteria bacterium]